MAEQRKKLRLGELLVQQGLITPDQLGIALAEQKQNNIPIGRPFSVSDNRPSCGARVSAIFISLITLIRTVMPGM